jgi:outer membrane protein assembly factor BamA
VATRTVRGGSVFGIWPLNRYRRLELTGGILQYNEEFNDPAVQEVSSEYQEEQFGQELLRTGTYIPFGVNFIQETTVFREFGPLSGNTMRLSYEIAPPIGSALSRQTAEADLRYYKRIGGSGLLALRTRAFKSWGEAADFMYFGGNSEMRGYEYLEFLGQEVLFMNAELRFPFIEAMLTPIGVMGGIRGVVFANMGGGKFDGQDFKWWSNSPEIYTPIAGYIGLQPIPGPPTRVDGFRLVDARASYGLGLETFALGFPIHFDWAWRTLFNKEWEDLRFNINALSDGHTSGSEWFRSPQFAVWIGYDF